MTITDYHAKLLAYRLTLRGASNSVDKIAGALADAQVELNPHQIDAALFAFQSPISNGVILADEVGLGKTIEAGLVAAQLWAERRRRILVIAPSSLRTQWTGELASKFHLPSIIMEAKSYNALRRDGVRDPLATEDLIVVSSYQFVQKKSEEIRQVPWDLVIIDEAHELKNVWKTGQKRANAIRWAVDGRKKLLLTATPLQNHLNEIYGLTSLLDPHIFGDRRSFVAQYATGRGGDYDHLKLRLKPLVQRTLRKQVSTYVRYTKRIAMVQPFTPSEDEQALYGMVTDYLADENLQSLPAGQRHLIRLILQKLQASSTFALAPTLERLVKRIESQVSSGQIIDHGLFDALDDEFEGLDELVEELDDEESDSEKEPTAPPIEPTNPPENAQLLKELAELQTISSLASGVVTNAKGDALLRGLRAAFAKAESLGAPRKAIVFTEFKRTQQYILELLRSTPDLCDNIVLFNGSNTDPESREIHAKWVKQHAGTDRISGSTADRKQALVDEFRDRGEIMIATEAAAQGLNLQFCSLVINYDLPWNPQRIEQRIGRCHRWGQKHDVIVLNFLDKVNAADQRVYELLKEKYQLFDGVFGASDEVLGDIAKGVNIERQIAEIYRNARKPAVIDSLFEQLQLAMQPEIDKTLKASRAKLFEHFDEEVASRLQGRKEDAGNALRTLDHDLMRLTRHELGSHANFTSDRSFDLHTPVPHAPDAPLGRYVLSREPVDGHVYRLRHLLAEALIDSAKHRAAPPSEIEFDYPAYGRKISVLEQLRGASGWMSVSVLTLQGDREGEDYLIVSAMSDEANPIPADIAEQFWRLPARVSGQIDGCPAPSELEVQSGDIRQSIVAAATFRNTQYFTEEQERLERFADDLRASLKATEAELERDIHELRKQIRATGNAIDRARVTRESLVRQQALDDLVDDHRKRRREIQTQQFELLDAVEARLKQSQTETPLFTIRWSMI